MDGWTDGCVCVFIYPSNRYHEDMVVGECIQSTCPVASSSFAFQTPCSITGRLFYMLLHSFLHLFC